MSHYRILGLGEVMEYKNFPRMTFSVLDCGEVVEQENAKKGLIRFYQSCEDLTENIMIELSSQQYKNLGEPETITAKELRELYESSLEPSTA